MDHVHDFDTGAGLLAALATSGAETGPWHVEKCSCGAFRFTPDPAAWTSLAIPEAYIVEPSGLRHAVEPAAKPTRELHVREHRYGQAWTPVAAFNDRTDAMLNDVRGLYRDELAPDEVRVERYIPAEAHTDERSAIVKWLREHARHHELAGHDTVARELNEKAMHIERGDHEIR